MDNQNPMNNPNTDDAGVPKAADPASLNIDPRAVGGEAKQEVSDEPNTNVEEMTRPFEPDTVEGEPTGDEPSDDEK